jgi:protein gp37
MAENSTIEWTDATWNPITGCSVVSPGCTNCYAMGLAGTRLKHHPSRAGLTVDSKAGPVWNGQVRLNEAWLTQPMLWSRPRKIFVCAHGDLFAEGVPDAWIDRVFAAMAASPQHTFQVLTKRVARMRAYLTATDVVERIIAALLVFNDEIGTGKTSRDPKNGAGWNAWAASENLKLGNEKSSWPLWPLKHVWLGVSAEDQRRADERVPDLLATPAAVRFVSAEPLLGFIDFESAWHGESALDSECWGQCGWCEKGYPALHNCQQGRGDWEKGRSGLDWIIVGGESGPGARPMHPDWARLIRDQCASAGVPFFHKQHGAWAESVGQSAAAPFTHVDGLMMSRVGKKLAGRLLDGAEHNGMPEVRP